MTRVFIKAQLADNRVPEKVGVKAHHRGLRWILPYDATRHKAIPPAPNQPEVKAEPMIITPESRSPS